MWGRSRTASGRTAPLASADSAWTGDGSVDGSDGEARSPEYLLEPLSVLSDASTTLSTVLTTDQKGAIAEAEIMAAAIRLGIGVYKPVSDGERCDLILECDRRLLRVQCKWAPRHGDVVVVRCRSCRRTGSGIRHRAYTASEVDAIAAYCPDLDCCFYVSADRFDGHLQLHLRLAPSRNNQRHRINWAEDFAFDARLRALVGP